MVLQRKAVETEKVLICLFLLSLWTKAAGKTYKYCQAIEIYGKRTLASYLFFGYELSVHRRSAIVLMADSLDVTILDSGSPGRVVALARCASDFAIVRLFYNGELQTLLDFRERIDRALRGLEKRPQVQELTDYGRRLFSFCVRDGLAQLYNRLPADHVRLHIFSDRTEIQTLPWEYLQDPNRVPGPQRERSVIRIVPTIGRDAPEPFPFGKKIRILFVSSDPVDQEPVSWPELKESVERTFAARLPADRFELEAVEGATRIGLTQLIAQRQFDVFHFSGHGDVQNGVGQLILTDRRTNKSSRLSAEELGLILNNRGIRLVVLSACVTATGNFADDFAVTAAAALTNSCQYLTEFALRRV